MGIMTMAVLRQHRVQRLQGLPPRHRMLVSKGDGHGGQPAGADDRTPRHPLVGLEHLVRGRALELSAPAGNDSSTSPGRGRSRLLKVRLGGSTAGGAAGGSAPARAPCRGARRAG